MILVHIWCFLIKVNDTVDDKRLQANRVLKSDTINCGRPLEVCDLQGRVSWYHCVIPKKNLFHSVCWTKQDISREIASFTHEKTDFLSNLFSYVFPSSFAFQRALRDLILSNDTLSKLDLQLTVYLMNYTQNSFQPEQF